MTPRANETSRASCILVDMPIESLRFIQSSAQAMRGSQRLRRLPAIAVAGRHAPSRCYRPSPAIHRPLLPGAPGSLPGEVTVFAEAVRLSINGPVKTTHTFVPGIQVDLAAVEAALRSLDPAALYGIDREYAPFWCRRAERATARRAGWSGSTTTRASTTAPAGAAQTATSGSWTTDMPTVNTTSTRRPPLIDMHISEVQLDRFIVGRPAPFATAGERPWKEAIAAALASSTPIAQGFSSNSTSPSHRRLATREEPISTTLRAGILGPRESARLVRGASAEHPSFPGAEDPGRADWVPGANLQRALA